MERLNYRNNVLKSARDVLVDRLLDALVDIKS